LQRDLVINFAQTRRGTLRYIFAITDSGPESGAGGRETSRLRNQVSAQWPIFFLFFQMLRSITMQPERWVKRLIARAIPFMTLGNPIYPGNHRERDQGLWREKIYVIVSS
jgi:hypothetical protein